MSKHVRISRTIWVLCFVSLFNDIGSEMLIPVMPVYLKSIGFSVLLIGILEGMAEAIAGLSKGYFGKLSDLKGRRMPFVQVGYLMSALAKPVMGLFTNAWWVFTARTADRLGKGVRTAARDALLSDEATPETKGRVFGLHRSFDTIGAICGPLLALIFLHYYPGEYRFLFFLAFIPGILTIAATFLVHEKPKPELPVNVRPGFFSFLHYWKISPGAYRKLVAGLIAFALINSSDAFLLLKVKEAGYSDQTVIGTYILYNLVYAIAAYPLGKIADRIGLKKVFLFGLVIFAITYAGVGYSQEIYYFMLFFVIYGLFAAATEGISKAWITNISQKEDTATAIGTYTAFQSIASLIASSAAGFIWYQFGSIYVFLLSALVAVFVAGYLYVFAQERVLNT
jgi:MFS family permease